MNSNIKINNTMIKCLIFIFVFAIVMFLGTLNRVYAKSVNLKVESPNNVKPGESFTTKVYLEGNEKGAAGIQCELKYDKNIFELVEKNIIKDGWSISVFNEETGKFLIELNDEAFDNKDFYVFNEEQIAEFVFKMKEDAISGNNEIKFSKVIIVDGAYNTTNLEQDIVKTFNLKFKIQKKVYLIIIFALIIMLVIFKKRKKIK